jgi:DeoR/GlpR family transcriptional regulator of sugar metabolism
LAVRSSGPAAAAWRLGGGSGAGHAIRSGFIGGCAMAPESGLTGFDYADCEFKKAVIKQCSEIIVGLTSDKIPAVARFVVVESSDIDVLVEENISREYRDAFQRARYSYLYRLTR